MEMQAIEPNISEDAITEPSTPNSVSSLSEENISPTESIKENSTLLNKYKKLYYKERVKAQKYKRLLRNSRNKLKNMRKPHANLMNP